MSIQRRFQPQLPAKIVYFCEFGPLTIMADAIDMLTFSSFDIEIMGGETCSEFRSQLFSSPYYLAHQF